MKKFIYFFVPFIILSYSLNSGVVVKSDTEYKSSKSENNMEATQYFEADYSRIEMKIKTKDSKEGKSEQNSIVIIRNDKKLIWTVIPEQKGYCEFTFDDLKKYLKSGTSLIPETTKVPKDFKLEKTSNTEKIAGFNATEYNFKKIKEKGKIWISENEKLNPITVFYNNMLKAIGESNTALKGVLLKLKSTSDEISYKTEVISVKFKDNDKSLFELPQGYSKLNKDIWKKYQKNFDTSVILKELRKQMAEKAEEEAYKAGKDAVKKGLKNIVGF